MKTWEYVGGSIRAMGTRAMVSSSWFDSSGYWRIRQRMTNQPTPVHTLRNQAMDQVYTDMDQVYTDSGVSTPWDGTRQ